MSEGERGMTRTPPPTTTAAGSIMFPAPRTMLPRMLNSQTLAAPPKTTVEYATAAASAPSRPPMRRNSAGPPSSIPRREERTDARRDHEGVRGEGVGGPAAARAERSGDGRRNAAAHAAGGHRLHEHDQREDERDPGERVRAKAAHEVGLQHVH